MFRQIRFQRLRNVWGHPRLPAARRTCRRQFVSQRDSLHSHILHWRIVDMLVCPRLLMPLVRSLVGGTELQYIPHLTLRRLQVRQPFERPATLTIARKIEILTT